MALENYQTDYLLLLVGGNPLPVYVSALQLATSQTKIKLLYSTSQSGSRHTTSLSKHLKEAIEHKLKCPVETLGIASAGKRPICEPIEDLIKSIPQQATIGLNYTGGTKQMVVYSWQLLEQKFSRHLVKSYLNAQDKHLYIDQGNTSVSYPVETGTLIKLDELLSLHGYERKRPLLENAAHYLFSNALALAHQTEAGIQAWCSWRGNEYRNENTLPNSDQYPDLQPVIEAMQDIGDGEPTPEKIARYLGYEHGQLTSCAKWFKGEWLEEWVLYHLLGVAEYFQLHNVGANLEIHPIGKPSQKLKAEIDVVAMKGHQLFAISCIASANSKSETKKHLFEAYTRARQLGGDEARVALVHLGTDKETLEHEINRDWLVSGAITVFGREQLNNFQNELYGWLRQHI